MFGIPINEDYLLPLQNMKKAVIVLAICFLISACAKIVTPSGGAIDRIPPKQLKSYPEQNSLNFKEREFVIEFDEYIVLDNVMQNLLVSPPLKVKPEVNAKLKKLYVKGLDSLAENTTYIFDFGNSICDFNEGNRLNGFKYSFSTGSHIDSLIFEGRVLEGFTMKPIADKYVMLFKDTLYSALYDNDCSYITKTDSNGWFAFSNIANSDYRVLVLDDKNQNKRYDLPTESIGFSEYAVSSYEKDSLNIEKKRRNLVFYEQVTDTVQKVVISKFLSKGVFLLSFANPLSQEANIDILNKDKTGEVLFEFSEQRDTVYVFSCSPSGFDTLNIKIKDGVYEEEISQVNSVKGKKKDEASCFGFEVIKRDSVDYYNALLLKTTLPLKTKAVSAKLINETDTASIKLLSDEFRRLSLPDGLQEGKKYKLVVDSASVENIAGEKNCEFSLDFYLTEKTDYGRLLLNCTDSLFASVPHLFYLCDVKSNVLQVIQTESGQSEVLFENIKEGNYRVKCVLDVNGNGKWDGMDFGNAKQGEKTAVFDKVVSIRRSWTMEENWNILW